MLPKPIVRSSQFSFPISNVYRRVCVCGGVYFFYKLRVAAIKCAKDLPAVVILIWMSLGLARYSVIANDFFLSKNVDLQAKSHSYSKA